MIDLIIKNGKIIDGTGDISYTSDIAIDNPLRVAIPKPNTFNLSKN